MSVARLIFFLFHPKNYYKLLLRETFSNNLTICRNPEEYMSSDICFGVTHEINR